MLAKYKSNNNNNNNNNINNDIHPKFLQPNLGLGFMDVWPSLLSSQALDFTVSQSHNYFFHIEKLPIG